MYNTEKYTFHSRKAAEEALEFLKRGVEKYEVVTLADFNDYCEISSDYRETKIGWFKNAINDAVITRMPNGWFIVISNPIEIEPINKPKVTYRDYYSTKKSPKDSSSEPLCITIHTEDIDNIDATLAEIFSYISTIKDRMVNLTIM